MTTQLQIMTIDNQERDSVMPATIFRRDYNALLTDRKQMNAGALAFWLSLNEAILRGDIRIVEDGCIPLEVGYHYTHDKLTDVSEIIIY